MLNGRDLLDLVTKGSSAALAYLFGPRPSATARRPERLYVLAVTDNFIAAKSALRMMKLSCTRYGSGFSDTKILPNFDELSDLRKLRFVPEGENATNDQNAAKDQPFREQNERGSDLGAAPELPIDFSFSVTFPNEDNVDVKSTVIMRLLPPKILNDEDFGAENLRRRIDDIEEKWIAAAPTGENREPVAPRKVLILGITDSSGQKHDRKDAGVGIDKALEPACMREFWQHAAFESVQMAIMVTGFERDFARFDRDDWSQRYTCAEHAARDPALIRHMLASVISERLHLTKIFELAQRHRMEMSRMTVTAVMPSGFLRGWGCVNYDPWNPGWLVGAPWLDKERDAPEFVPYQCADALISALTGKVSRYQLTTDDHGALNRLAARAPWRRRHGRAAA